MDDDFNTALAIAAIFDYTKVLNSYAKAADLAALNDAKAALDAIDGVILALSLRPGRAATHLHRS